MKKFQLNSLLLAFVIVQICAALIPNAVTAAPVKSSTVNLSETNALERELDSMKKSLAATNARLKRLQSSVYDARKTTEQVSAMIRKIGDIEKKLVNVERQLNSLTKIPQLKALKLVLKGVTSVRSKIQTINAKANSFDKTVVKPATAKLRNAEAELKRVRAKFTSAEGQVMAASAHVSASKKTLMMLGNQGAHIRVLEGMSRSLRITIDPAKRVVSEMDRRSYEMENMVNNFRSKLAGLLSLQSGISKLQSNLSPVDKTARDLSRVMDKTLQIKLPFGKQLKISVRRVLEAPDKLLKVVAKPLTALANKALSPFKNKVNIKFSAPREIEQIYAKIKQLQSQTLPIDTTLSKLKNAANGVDFAKFQNALRDFIGKKLSGSKPQRPSVDRAIVIFG